MKHVRILHGYGQLHMSNFTNHSVLCIWDTINIQTVSSDPCKVFTLISKCLTSRHSAVRIPLLLNVYMYKRMYVLHVIANLLHRKRKKWLPTLTGFLTDQYENNSTKFHENHLKTSCIHGWTNTGNTLPPCQM